MNPRPWVIAIFGPTSVGKTAVAIELAEILREREENPVAISCDSIAIYEGLEILSGAPSAAERERLAHRLVGTVPLTEEFSVGRFAELAQAEIDAALASGKRPILVGGTGLYMRAALSDLDLAPPVDPKLRSRVEQRLDREGPEVLHAELTAEVAERIDPRDRKRVGRALELELSGEQPPELKRELWSKRLRHRSLLIGLSCPREDLDRRISTRVEAMVEAGVVAEIEAADRAGASRTARAALGFVQFPQGEAEAVKRAHRRYARRQITWMGKMEGLWQIDRGPLSSAETAAEIVAALD